MEFKLDRNRKYALALEGGGGRGAYEIGAWKALREEGIQLIAVSGTSVGAINGAAVASDDMETAERFWKSLTYSQVMEVDDSVMESLMKKDFLHMDVVGTAKTLKGTLLNRGFDITPLRQTLMEAIDEDKVRSSPVEFYIVTFSIDDMKEVVVRAKDLADGELYDMMIASAYLPVFRNEKLGGKRYVDGGVYNRLPISTLADKGYRDIIAIELNSIGPIQKYDEYGSDIHFIKPVSDLGGLMQFEPAVSERNFRLGYFDAIKMMYGLSGSSYYLDRRFTEEEAHSSLVRFISSYCRHENIRCSLRLINENYIPALAGRVRASKEDYYGIFAAALESAAEAAGIDRFHIFTEQELLAKVLRIYDPASGNIPKPLTRSIPSFTKGR